MASKENKKVTIMTRVLIEIKLDDEQGLERMLTRIGLPLWKIKEYLEDYADLEHNHGIAGTFGDGLITVTKEGV